MNQNEFEYYSLASRDVNTGSIPHRNGSAFKWSNGQEAILNKKLYKDLRDLRFNSELLIKEKNVLLNQMIGLQSPIDTTLEVEEHIRPELLIEIETEKQKLKQFKSELDQFEKDMVDRGLWENVRKLQDKNEDGLRSEGEKKWKEVLSFLGIWIIGEIFMTYVQWSALRDEKGLSDLIVRSFSFGITLGLFHLIAHLNKKQVSKIYQIYMVFNILMLLIMLFAPLAINKLYPINNSTVTTADEWITTENTTNTTNTNITEYPFLVEFYRSYEVTPAILSFIFFISMISFKRTKQKPNEEKAIGLEVKEKTIEEQIYARKQYFINKITDCEFCIKDLQGKLASVKTSNTGIIKDISDKLEAHKNSILTIEKKIAEINTKIEELFNLIELELNKYKTDFIAILSNDTKKGVISPDWPNREDIFKFFKI